MMMRKILLSGFLFAFIIGQARAQYDCNSFAAVDSLSMLYEADGEQLFTRTIDQSVDVKVSVIRLPYDQITRITSALLSIYNDSDLPHWEEIVERYQIHTRNDISSRKIQLLVDTASLWRFDSHLDPTSFASGDSELDLILNEFQIFLLNPARYVQTGSSSETYLQLDMKSKFPLNISILIKRLKSIYGIVDVRPLLSEAMGESTTDIELKTTDEYQEFTFRYSWNCTDGTDCQNDHFWIYRVYQDCTTEFVAEKGDLLPVREIPGFISTGIYPNPTSDLVSVQLVGPTDKDIRVILFSAHGQVLESRAIETQSGFIELEFSLKDRPKGLYFIGLISQGRVLTEKILKN